MNWDVKSVVKPKSTTEGFTKSGDVFLTKIQLFFVGQVAQVARLLVMGRSARVRSLVLDG